MNESTTLKFADVRKAVREHLRAALNVDVSDFTISSAKLEGNEWLVNVEYSGMKGVTIYYDTTLFKIDAVTGEVKEFQKGRYWTF